MLSGAVLLLYLIAFNAYIYLLSNSMLSPKQYKLTYNYITAGFFIFTFIDRLMITEASFHSQVNIGCFFALVCNYLLIILTHHQIIMFPEYEFWLFNGLVFATVLPILIFGGKHGLLKD